ncbi:MAG: hypothetical protein KDM91_10165, partial [Verrucomicrobiae bacterium]|nr:hypothetical protein [Verrucomicrobiae bacterium]
MTKTQGIVFFGIILLGLGVSLVTLNRCGKPVEVATADPASPESKPGEKGEGKGDAAKDGGKAMPQPDAESKPAAPEATPKPTPATFSSPEALVGALVEKVRARDVAGFLEIAGDEAVSPVVKPRLEEWLKDPAYAPDPERPISELAKSADSVRWAIHLKPAAAANAPAPSPGSTAASEGSASTTNPASQPPSATPATTAAAKPAEREIFADVASPDEKSWEVKRISLPLDFTGTAGGATTPSGAPMPAPGTPGKPGNVTAPGAGAAAGSPNAPPALGAGQSDAITVAHAFSQAIMDKNFELARQLTDRETVTDERVAALMIALEEGGFRLREDKPLVVTLSRDDLTWVLSRIDSATTSSEFALEMARVGKEDPWLINGLTFSKLLAALAESAGAGGVAYAPIVTDPQGGDSLVLYFDFDDTGVTSRSDRQLRIVAQILARDASRKIHINGHADALGTD